MYYYRNSSGGRRHPHGIIYGFPWFLIFVFLIAPHNGGWFLMTFFAIMLLNLFIRSITSRTVNSSTVTTNTSTQQPYYQPYQPYYQAPEPVQQPSYEQGYQAAMQENRQASHNERDPQYPYQETGGYDQYEQPQAQYPEQMPPMQQQ